MRMSRDPIVDEVRTIREKLAARFEFDIRKIVKDAQERQATSQARIVSFQKPKQALQPTRAATSVSEKSQVAEAAQPAEL